MQAASAETTAVALASALPKSRELDCSARCSCRGMISPVRVLAAAAVLALALVAAANAAAPRLIMVSGDALADRILVSEAGDVFELCGSFYQGRPVDRSSL